VVTDRLASFKINVPPLKYTSSMDNEAAKAIQRNNETNIGFDLPQATH
jgi:hypothetical protein